MPIIIRGRARRHYRGAQTVIADAMAHLNRQVKAGMTIAELDANAAAWRLLLDRYLALDMTTPTTPHPLPQNAARPARRGATTPTPPHPHKPRATFLQALAPSQSKPKIHERASQSGPPLESEPSDAA